MTEDAPHPFDHNQPVPAEVIADEIATKFKEFEPRRDQLLKAGRDLKIVDNDTVARAADQQSMIRTLIEKVRGTAIEIAQPHTAAVSVAKNRLERWIQELETVDAGLAARIADFRNAQRRKIAEQQAEQAQVTAQLIGTPEMPAPTPKAQEIKLAPVRADYGSTVSDRAKATFAWEDPRKLPDQILNHKKVKAAIEQACRDLYRIQDTIDGVTIGTEYKDSHRKPT